MIENNANAVELTEKVVCVNRVTKVVKGGRNFGFAAMVVVGDRKGMVGYGTGKAKEVAEARAKASKAARKNLVRVALRENRTIHHDSRGKFGAAKVFIRNAPSGTGIIAGGAMRAVFEAAGIHDIVSKSLATSNPYNLVKATFDALLNTESPKKLALKRGKKVGDIISQRNEKADAKEVVEKAGDKKEAPKRKEKK